MLLELVNLRKWQLHLYVLYFLHLPFLDSPVESTTLNSSGTQMPQSRRVEWDWMARALQWRFKSLQKDRHETSCFTTFKSTQKQPCHFLYRGQVFISLSYNKIRVADDKITRNLSYCRRLKRQLFEVSLHWWPQIKFRNKLIAKNNHGQCARMHGFVAFGHFMAGAGL